MLHHLLLSLSIDIAGFDTFQKAKDDLKEFQASRKAERRLEFESRSAWRACKACLEHLHGHAERVPHFRRWKALAKWLGAAREALRAFPFPGVPSLWTLPPPSAGTEQSRLPVCVSTCLLPRPTEEAQLSERLPLPLVGAAGAQDDNFFHAVGGVSCQSDLAPP